jgi:hypothetical protein
MNAQKTIEFARMDHDTFFAALEESKASHAAAVKAVNQHTNNYEDLPHIEWVDELVRLTSVADKLAAFRQDLLELAWARSMIILKEGAKNGCFTL